MEKPKVLYDSQSKDAKVDKCDYMVQKPESQNIVSKKSKPL